MFRFSSSLDFKSMNLESMNDTFKRNAQLCVDYVCNYANTIDSRPVTPDVKPGYLRDLLPGKTNVRISGLRLFVDVDSNVLF